MTRYYYLKNRLKRGYSKKDLKNYIIKRLFINVYQ